MKMDQALTVQTAIQRDHIYQCIWDAANDSEILCCEREVSNFNDPSAVAIKKGTATI